MARLSRLRDDPVALLDERDHVVDDAVGKPAVGLNRGIEAPAWRPGCSRCPGCSRRCGGCRCRGRPGRRGRRHDLIGRSGLVRVPVGHHDDHRLGFALRDQVVHDLDGAPVGRPCVFVAAGAVQQIEDRVGDLGVFVAGRRVDVEPAREIQRRGLVPDLRQRAVRNVVDFVQIAAGPGNDQDVLETRAVPVEAGDAAIEHRNAVDDERIGVQLGLQRADGNRPDALFVLRHRDRLAGGPFAVEGDRRGVRRREAECHAGVGKDLRRPGSLGALLGEQRGGHQHQCGGKAKTSDLHE